MNKSTELLLFESYIASIKNSVGSKLFRNLYAGVNKKKKDITQNGRLSCAFFVSSVLVMFRFIKRNHATVAGTIKDMKRSGWKETDRPEVGNVIVWSKDKDSHRHIGFYIGNKKAISNSSKKGYPIIHHWIFNKKRNIESIWKPL